MRKLVLQYLLVSFLLWVLDRLMVGIRFELHGLFMMAAFLTLVTRYIKPFLNLISFPLNILSFGLFSLVLNVMLLFLGASLLPGVQVKSVSDLFVLDLCFSIFAAVIFPRLK